VKERRPQVTLCRSHSGRLFAQSDQRSKPTHTLLCPYNVELPALIANSGVAEQHTSHYLLLLLCSPCLCLLSLPAFLLPYQDLSTQLVSFNKACPTLSSFLSTQLVSFKEACPTLSSFLSTQLVSFKEACPTLSSFLSTQLVSFKEACPSALLDYAKLATRSTVPPNDLPFRQPHPTIYDTIYRSTSPTQRSTTRSTVPPASPNDLRHDLPFRQPHPMIYDTIYCSASPTQRSTTRSTVPPAPPNDLRHDLPFRQPHPTIYDTIHRSASPTQRHDLPFRTIYRSAKRSTVPPAPPNVMICRSARSTVPPHDLAFRHTIYRSASRTQRHEAQCVSAGYPYAFVLSGRAVLSTVTLLFLVDMLS